MARPMRADPNRMICARADLSNPAPGSRAASAAPRANGRIRAASPRHADRLRACARIPVRLRARAALERAGEGDGGCGCGGWRYWAWLCCSPGSRACCHAEPIALDAIARDYVRLQLEIGARDEGYIDAYYGPPEVRAAAAANPRSLEELQPAVEALRSRLRADRGGRPGRPAPGVSRRPAHRGGDPPAACCAASG